MGRPSKAELQAHRRAAGQQPASNATENTTTASKPRKMTTTRRSHPPPEQRTAQPVAVPLDPDGVPLFDPLLTADQVALWLRKPKATLYAWRTRGLGPRGIKVGGDLRYRRSDVEAYIEQNADPRDIA